MSEECYHYGRSSWKRQEKTRFKAIRGEVWSGEWGVGSRRWAVGGGRWGRGALVSTQFPHRETADSLQSRRLVLRFVRFPATARTNKNARPWPADLPTANQPAKEFGHDPVM